MIYSDQETGSLAEILEVVKLGKSRRLQGKNFLKFDFDIFDFDIFDFDIFDFDILKGFIKREKSQTF